MGNSLAKQQNGAGQGIGLHNFRLLRVIGRGSFGKVRIVEHRGTGKTYALKYINKATCIGMKAQNNTVRERGMLEEIDHPFVVNLRFSFQDEYTMYMVMDLMIGGDLRFHMMRRRFVEGVIRFWIAELACAINYLHTAHSIVHRDIKPDNILMDHRGHVALTDFNIATRVRSDNSLHYAVAGTANYMAPEVVSGVGYTYSVDWWSLGVVMYECVYGKRPFRHRKSGDELKRALMYEEIQFPIIADVQVSYDCISAMRALLTKDPSQRIGFDGIKAHPFFAAINWDRLEAKLLDPPFAPSADQSNFDISHDLEEMLLEPEPLDPRKRSAMRKNRSPPEHATPEYEDLERHFAAFDYIEYEAFRLHIQVNGSISTATSAKSITLDNRPIGSNRFEPVSAVEPPSCVPIDILTWNQLLPEQRSLAYRYCNKMTHDNCKRSSDSERSSALLSARERRQSLKKRQHSVDGIQMSSKTKPKAKAMPLELELEASRHYLHQPLPQIPTSTDQKIKINIDVR
ncbi:hypothetical protein H4217_006714 [Coemansia sp. RSA 1939]|nr:hypothetical protein H4217_006714 [Coemansia sp. RSA 1939]KAJ2607128.1 hypothetical protein EV177_005691 [Coemansia sp. RSA 1804]KAJ2687085.1 hypothetical protein GGH99_003333 [Coemansia sp. RSA 1285]